MHIITSSSTEEDCDVLPEISDYNSNLRLI